MLLWLKNTMSELVMFLTQGNKEEFKKPVFAALDYLINHESLDELLKDPVSSICRINVYMSDIDDLFNNTLSKDITREISDVNINRYIGKTVNLSDKLQRLKDIIGSQGTNHLVEHDLCELYETCQFLDSIREEYVERF